MSDSKEINDPYAGAAKAYDEVYDEYDWLTNGDYKASAEKSTLISFLQEKLYKLDTIPVTSKVGKLKGDYYALLRDLHLHNGNLRMQFIMALRLMNANLNYDMDKELASNAEDSYQQAVGLVSYLREAHRDLDVSAETIDQILSLFFRAANGEKVRSVEIDLALKQLQNSEERKATPPSSPKVSASIGGSASSLALNANAAPAVMLPPAANGAGLIANNNSGSIPGNRN